MKEVPFIMLNDKDPKVPLYRQIYEAIRGAILSGDFESEMRLPASRFLAKQLGVSRMTVVNAYEQLFAEGYLEGKTGAGTFVAAHLPEEFLQTSQINSENNTKSFERKIKLSDYGNHLTRSDYAVLRSQRPSAFVPFQHGVTAIDKFPFDVWAKIAQKWHKNPPRGILGYGDSAGFRPLREAIAAHLKAARGVRCTAEQVIITSGTQQTIDLIARILLESPDRVWMEEPCYVGARDIFASQGAKISHITVDEEGFDVARAQKQSQTARMVYVTPSHQFPTGVTMSLVRRLSLLEWASANDAWILEDDYNSEFRYAGRPLASLQGLDRDGRVIYVGTFSKTIFPALRLGCAVLPTDLVKVFCAARALSDLHSPIVNQAVLADFIAEGHFARHIRRMRGIYEARQECLVEEIRRQLAGFVEISKAEAGMHVIGWLPEGVKDYEIAQKARQSNLNIAPLSNYCNRDFGRGGLLFGYTGFDEKQIEEGVKKLAEMLV
jgi:GntR family transcriptional regulator / MocR family aminotransferase